MYNEIKTHMESLGFKGMLPIFDELAKQEDTQWQELLIQLLEAEATYRHTRSFMYRLGLARLPQIKTLENFKLAGTPIESKILEQLCDCEFVKGNENIMLIGGSGTGKTHIALALGYAALQRSYRIKFYRFSELARSLLDAQEHRYADRFIARLQRFHLIVVDELGYMPIDQKAGALLFELFSGLYEKASVIVTTHLTFDEWADIFGNKKATKAMIDRLTHHCQILETGNVSWRLKEHETKQEDETSV